jgi:hypothetical protein
MAQGRDLDPEFLRDVKDRGAILGFSLNSIDFQFDSFHAA